MAIFHEMELINLVPNSLSFRIISTLDISDESEVPEGFTGRVRLSAGDYLAYIAWYEGGKLHNPSRNQPAFRRFRRDGRVKFEMFYTEGEVHDPNPTTPAVRGYFDNNSVHYEERFHFGRRNDGADGSPAIRKYRADGTIRHDLRYSQGIRQFGTERKVPSRTSA